MNKPLSEKINSYNEDTIQILSYDNILLNEESQYDNEKKNTINVFFIIESKKIIKIKGERGEIHIVKKKN